MSVDPSNAHEAWRAYQEAQRKLRSDALSPEPLVAAQAAWERYLDAFRKWFHPAREGEAR